MIASAATIITTVGAILSLAKVAISLGKDAMPFVQALRETFAGDKEITEEELALLQAKVDALSDELMAPLPDEEPGPA